MISTGKLKDQPETDGFLTETGQVQASGFGFARLKQEREALDWVRSVLQPGCPCFLPLIAGSVPLVMYTTLNLVFAPFNLWPPKTPN